MLAEPATIILFKVANGSTLVTVKPLHVGHKTGTLWVVNQIVLSIVPDDNNLATVMQTGEHFLQLIKVVVLRLVDNHNLVFKVSAPQEGVSHTADISGLVLFICRPVIKGGIPIDADLIQRLVKWLKIRLGFFLKRTL